MTAGASTPAVVAQLITRQGCRLKWRRNRPLLAGESSREVYFLFSRLSMAMIKPNEPKVNEDTNCANAIMIIVI